MGEVTYGKWCYGRIRFAGSQLGKVTVGNFTAIAGGVHVFMGVDHNVEAISQYPFGADALRFSRLLPSKPIQYEPPYKFEVNIGSDVWLGEGCMIFRDVTIGHGAIIGAYTKVLKDVPPYAIVVGHSRVVRKRFSDDDIKFLLELKWWDLPDETIVEIVPILMTSDIAALRKWADAN